MTQSPTFTLFESPKTTSLRLSPSIFRIAKSVFESSPITTASYFSPLYNVTVIFPFWKPSITWKLVSIYPAFFTMIPEPKLGLLWGFSFSLSFSPGRKKGEGNLLCGFGAVPYVPSATILTTEGATKLDTFWKICTNGLTTFSSSMRSCLNLSASSSANTLWLISRKTRQIVIL